MKQPPDIVIVGAGGFGREIYAYATDAHTSDATAGRVVGFADDNPDALRDLNLPIGILGTLDNLAVSPSMRFLVAVGDPAMRRRFAAAVLARGGRLGRLVHPTAYVAQDARLAHGCVVCPFAFVGTGAAIAANCAINIYASVGHDAVVGDNCVLSPYATINGQVTLGDDVFLGTHATVTPRRTIGTGTKVSAGSVVTRDVPARSLAIGNPARSRVLFAVVE